MKANVRKRLFVVICAAFALLLAALLVTGAM